jgi:hypothetical protein
MAYKYNNQIKVSLNRYQVQQLQALHQILGISKQDVLRKALDSFVLAENERRLRRDPHAAPLPGL